METRAGLFGENRALPGSIDPKAISIAYLYRSAPVPVNIQFNVEFEGVNREEAIYVGTTPCCNQRSDGCGLDGSAFEQWCGARDFSIRQDGKTNS